MQPPGDGSLGRRVREDCPGLHRTMLGRRHGRWQGAGVREWGMGSANVLGDVV